MNSAYMTRKTFERLNRELTRLRDVEMPRVSREKGEAASQGDLRENAGYEAAKEKLELLNARVLQISGSLAGAQIIEELPIPGTMVSIGTKVRIEDLDSRLEEEYTILGPEDTDIVAGIISYQSPLAKGLIAKKPGDECVVEIPSGERRIRVCAVEKYAP